MFEQPQQPMVTPGKSDREIVIQAGNVHKIYDTGKVKVHALRGIDLTVGAGEMVGIMGPSGCGKTTMLNCLSGLDDLNEGTVHLEGKLLNAMSDDEKTGLRAHRMGFIFQFFNLLPVLTAVENVELPLLVGGVKPAEARVRALKMLEVIGLKEQAHQKPAELSGGQQQRVAIARSLVNRPAIVWADEPTGNLDSETSNDIVDLLVELNRKNNQTFIVITHDPRVGQRMDRIVWMESGHIVDDGLSGNSDRLKQNLDCLVEADRDGVAEHTLRTDPGAEFRGGLGTSPGTGSGASPGTGSGTSPGMGSGMSPGTGSTPGRGE